VFFSLIGRYGVYHLVEIESFNFRVVIFNIYHSGMMVWGKFNSSRPAII
jgi:hypothetical protein